MPKAQHSILAAGMHANDLWERFDEVFNGVSYPLGMEAATKHKGHGFFPSCLGTWDEPHRPLATHGKLLFLGQDFGNENHLRWKSREDAKGVPTWRNLQDLIDNVGIDARRCFFSNVIMGVRTLGSKNTGDSPAFLDQRFIGACLTFLQVQIDIVKPERIVVMGLPAMHVFRQSTVSHLPDSDSFKSWDGGQLPRVHTVRIGDRDYLLAFIVHPSYRHKNTYVRTLRQDRKTGGLEGDLNEIALLKELIGQQS